MADEFTEVQQGRNIEIWFDDPNRNRTAPGDQLSFYAQWEGPNERAAVNRVLIQTVEEGYHQHKDERGNVMLWAQLPLEQPVGTYVLTLFEIRQGWHGPGAEPGDEYALEEMPAKYRTIRVTEAPPIKSPKRELPKPQPPR